MILDPAGKSNFQREVHELKNTNIMQLADVTRSFSTGIFTHKHCDIVYFFDIRPEEKIESSA